MEKTEKGVGGPADDEGQHDDKRHSEDGRKGIYGRIDSLEGSTSSPFEGISPISTKKKVVLLEGLLFRCLLVDLDQDERIAEDGNDEGKEVDLEDIDDGIVEDDVFGDVAGEVR